MASIILEDEVLILDKPFRMLKKQRTIVQITYNAVVEDGDEESNGSPICKELCVESVLVVNEDGSEDTQDVLWDKEEVPCGIWFQLLSSWSEMLADAR